MGNAIIIFVHVMGAAVAIGAGALALFVLLPQARLREKDSTPDETSLTYLLMDRLAPTMFTAILVLVFSGIYYLMENYTDQVNLREGYYNVLGVKLIFVLPAFFFSAYQTFMLKPDISNIDLQPERRKRIPEVLKKMETTGKVAFAAVCLAVFMGIYLARY
ncbi:MAG: hypothetical protein G3M70_02455 [Candidatus Nitronauta litoralis]|uniref:Copper resistance protein D domain-containing protein n=1 Tax=Candidatus Nitronauta litoralis TaxID=2705533 RepID=A0A7T0BTU4_9BACT|nr:MAG: hypothetical protein G3M70_02455 [Candidatus Nitronauta litoralis]